MLEELDFIESFWNINDDYFVRCCYKTIISLFLARTTAPELLKLFLGSVLHIASQREEPSWWHFTTHLFRPCVLKVYLDRTQSTMSAGSMQQASRVFENVKKLAGVIRNIIGVQGADSDPALEFDF